MWYPKLKQQIRLFGFLAIILAVSGSGILRVYAAGPEIIYFRGSPDTVEPTETVTLSWSVTGAHHVEISWLAKPSHSGYNVRRNLPLTGSLSVSISEVDFAGDTISFNLDPKDANDQYYYQAIPGRKPVTIKLKSDLKVLAFTAGPDPAARGGMLTLSWDVVGASRVSITRLSEYGNIFLQDIGGSLPAKGSLSYKIPNDYIQAIPFILLAKDSAGVGINSTIRVAITCPYTNSFIQNDCPITQQQIQAAYQPFENGFMIWRGDTHEIYVFYTNKTYKKFPDTWKEGETVSVPDTPPAGRIQPARGFGKVWTTQPDVRRLLGWAVATETGYTTPLETHRGNFGRYPYNYPVFKLPDARIVSTGSPINLWVFIS